VNIVVAYVFPQINRPVYDAAAFRFANSYRQFKDATPHRLLVISNGRPPDRLTEAPFKGIDCDWITHDNLGKDIGAFQRASSGSPADLLICCGAHVHFWRQGWLERIVEVYCEQGPGLYGAWGFHQPSQHLRTTFFWLPPALFNTYPMAPVPNHMRYEFEHGRNSLTQFVASLGFPVLMVTFKDCLPLPEWRHAEREECLALDQHSDRIGYG
jgi:hypothetical protein